MKKTVYRLIALLLALLMLPFAPAMAAEDANFVTIRAVDLFGGEESTVVLLQGSGRYYITLVEAGDLAGLPIAVGPTGFSGGRLTVTPDISALEFTRVGDTTYYALEQLMNEFQVQIVENGDGNLYYNSVPKNIEKLLAETDRVMSTDYYSADLLEDMGYSANFISAFSFVYDAVIHLRFNAIWGGAYTDDINSLMLTLIQPTEDETNLFETANQLNEAVNTAADIILKRQDYFEDFRNAVLLTPESYDYLLFGREGTASLREFLETTQEVNNADFFDVYLRSRLGYSGMKEYQAAADEMDAGALSGVSALGIGDLLDAGEYIVGITQVTQTYATALERVLSAGDFSSGLGTLEKIARGTIYDQGRSVLGDYRLYVEQNLPGAIARGSAALLETVAENMTLSVLETALLGEAKLLSGILTYTSTYFSGTVVKNDAVRNMTMYTQIQSLFQDCYNTTAAGRIDADAALLMKSAALMYLKSAWHSVGAYSFDTGSESLVDILRNSPGTPTGRLLGLIRGEMLALAEFPAEMFVFIENKTVFSSDTFSHTYSTGNPAQYHELFLEFLRSLEWLSSASFDISGIPLDDYERLQWGYYYFHDVDQNGTDDLVIVAGTTIADACCMVFTGRDGFINSCGTVDCAFGLSVFASGDATGLILSEAHGGLGYDSYLDIADGALTVLKTEEYNYERAGYVSGIPSGWTQLEGSEIGSLFSGDVYAGEEGDSEFPVDDTIEVDCLGGRLTLTLPGTWLGHFLTVEGEQSVSFYNKENREADESTGLLFTVILSDYQSEKELEAAGYPDYRNLGRWKGGLIVALLPSDMPFSDHDLALVDIYVSIAGDVETVLNTVKLND